MRIVVKVGSSTLTHTNGHLRIRTAETLCRALCDLKNSGNEVVLVSSGAISMGVGKLGLSARPHDMPGKQAAAAVGQCELMYAYDKLFTEYAQCVAQILLTGEDLQHADRCENFRNTVTRLLSLSVLPIINENDTVSTDEIAVGDNDSLAAIVAANLSADLLVLLSDIDGLYTADPHKDAGARFVPVVEEITPEIRQMAGGAGSAMGTGGMQTKLRGAALATDAGCDMIIMNGEDPRRLYDLQTDRAPGTRFLAARPEKGEKK